jgi:hypothetical protein
MAINRFASKPGDPDHIEPTQEQRNLCALYGWEIVGYDLEGYRESRRCLLSRSRSPHPGANSHEDVLSLHMAASIEDWIEKLHGL